MSTKPSYVEITKSTQCWKKRMETFEDHSVRIAGSNDKKYYQTFIPKWWAKSTAALNIPSSSRIIVANEGRMVWRILFDGSASKKAFLNSNHPFKVISEEPNSTPPTVFTPFFIEAVKPHIRFSLDAHSLRDAISPLGLVADVKQMLFNPTVSTVLQTKFCVWVDFPRIEFGPANRIRKVSLDGIHFTCRIKPSPFYERLEKQKSSSPSPHSRAAPIPSSTPLQDEEPMLTSTTAISPPAALVISTLQEDSLIQSPEASIETEALQSDLSAQSLPSQPADSSPSIPANLKSPMSVAVVAPSTASPTSNIMLPIGPSPLSPSSVTSSNSKSLPMSPPRKSTSPSKPSLDPRLDLYQKTITFLESRPKAKHPPPSLLDLSKWVLPKATVPNWSLYFNTSDLEIFKAGILSVKADYKWNWKTFYPPNYNLPSVIGIAQRNRLAAVTCFLNLPAIFRTTNST